MNGNNDYNSEEYCDTSSNDIAFIKRTQNLIKQYPKLVKDKRKSGSNCISYSRTLFMNCCLGLLFIPREMIYSVPLFSSPAKDWGIKTDDFIMHNGDAQNIKLNELIRHLRNALAHNNVTYQYDKNKVLRKLNFNDRNGDRSTFSGALSYRDFETLVALLADYTVYQNRAI